MKLEADYTIMRSYTRIMINNRADCRIQMVGQWKNPFQRSLLLDETKKMEVFGHSQALSKTFLCYKTVRWIIRKECELQTLPEGS